MLKRVLTAAVLMPVAAALVLWAPAWLFFLGVLPFALLALWEYLELASRLGALSPRLVVYLAGLGLWLVAALWPAHLLAALVGAGLLLFLTSLARREVSETYWAAVGAVFGLLYVAVPFALVLDLRAAPAGPWILLYLLLLIWAGDTAAYFGGRALGRHKLAPVISPGKTVEGTVASLVATVAVGYFLFRAWFSEVPALHAVLVPVVINAAAQLGDLAESALKRSAGVKDSSALLPGHGGMLDRLDSLLFAAPALWYYWNLLGRSVAQP